jgi:hypothetical protein
LIKRVVIDVSGEPFVDLAREARAAFALQRAGQTCKKSSTCLLSKQVLLRTHAS